MTMTTAVHSSELMDLVFQDWEGTRRAHLEAVPASATVGEVVAEAVRTLQLPMQTFYQALSRGHTLDPTDTLKEAGIQTGEELELMPEVSAGRLR